MKLQGKTAIITGAAKGIGAAAARRFAAEGARIVLADKDEANGHEVAKAIVKEGGEAAFCLCDVGNEADVQAALDTAARTYGKLDIVVNNAGWQLNKTLLETTAEEFNAVLNTNLTSMFLFTKGAANMFIAQKTGGAIVNVCSTFAVVGSPGYVAYHASKGGVASFTRAAAISLMPHNIRVNAVGPGTTETPGLHDGARDTGDEAKGMASFLALQPLKRFGKPEEIASVISSRERCGWLTEAIPSCRAASAFPLPEIPLARNNGMGRGALQAGKPTKIQYKVYGRSEIGRVGSCMLLAA